MKYVKSISLFFVFPICMFLTGIWIGRQKTEPLQDPIDFSESVFEESVEEEAEEVVMNHDAVIEIQEIKHIQPQEGYILCVREGVVAVYHADNETVYLLTDIPYAKLPEDVQAELESGIYVSDEGMLYDFLENYTS